MGDKNGQELRQRNLASVDKPETTDRVESIDRRTRSPSVPKERKLKPPTCCQWLTQKIIKPILIVFLLVVVVGIIYAIYTESPIDAAAFDLPPPPAFEGPLAPNTKLQDGRRLLEGKISGPESLAYYKGNIYTGTYNGEILRISTTDYKIRRLARLGVKPCGTPADEPTCGRPLGIIVDNGRIYVVDAYLGLFEVEDGTGKSTELANNKRTYDGKQVAFANDLAKFSKPDGDFFVTDSSRKWQRRQYPQAIFESKSCGRLLWYNPKSTRSNVALSKLHFPNGIVMSPNEEFVLIAETSRFRILRYYVDGPNAGTVEVFADNLPGVPDNIRPSSTGGYWVGLAFVGARMGSHPIADYLAPRPWLRNIIAKFVDPGKLFPYLPKYGMIIELDQEGKIVRSLHDPTGEVVSSVSEVLDTGDALYLGSFNAPYLVKVDMSQRTMNM